MLVEGLHERLMAETLVVQCILLGWHTATKQMYLGAKYALTSTSDIMGSHCYVLLLW